MTVYERVKMQIGGQGVTVVELARRVGAGPSTTYEALELLRARGEVEREAIRGKTGRPAWRYWKAYW